MHPVPGCGFPRPYRGFSASIQHVMQRVNFIHVWVARAQVGPRAGSLRPLPKVKGVRPAVFYRYAVQVYCWWRPKKKKREKAIYDTSYNARHKQGASGVMQSTILLSG